MDEKDHLGIKKLSEKEKVDLFNRFISGGGKVLNEKRRRQLDRRGRKDPTGAVLGTCAEEESIDGSGKLIRRKTTFGDRVSLYFKALFNKVITLDGKPANYQFVRFIRQKAIPQLKNFHFLIMYILFSDDQTLSEIKLSLNKKKHYYDILLTKYGDIFIEEDFNDLLNFYKRSGSNEEKLRFLHDPVQSILKRIYILYNYMNGSLVTVKTALAVLYKNKKWSKFVYKARINQVRQTLNLIYHQLFPKLFALFLFIRKEKIRIGSKRIENCLSINEIDKVEFLAYRDSEYVASQLPTIEPDISSEEDAGTDPSKVKYIKKEFNDITDDDFKKLGLDEEMIYGLKLLQDVDVKTIIASIHDPIELGHLPEKDKIFHVYAYLKEFENEYLFLLTSQKITIKTYIEDNQRVDYKNKVNALYMPMINIYDIIKNYLQTLRDYDAVTQNSVMDPVSRNNQMNFLEGEKSNISYKIRQDTIVFFTEIKEFFNKFINDYNTGSEIISNPDEILHFDKDLEGIKKAENKKIIDSIKEANAFIMALIYRMEQGGDLCGIAIELVGIDVPDEGSVPESETGEKHQKSFLDEIEDTLKKDNKE
ncbi:MAG: hypothetical protein KKH98_15800 [Spirochaetes bacterium]|nr:hypothetical protein [Spirochaetota bacterium]